MILPIDQIPTPKSERWKYTNLPRALSKMALAPAHLGWGVGHPAIERSAPGSQVYKDTALWTLNTDYISDTRLISVDEEIEIQAVDGQWLSPRIVIDVKDNQNLTVVEKHSGQGSYWKNTVVQIQIGNNARLRHYRIIEEGDQGVSTIFSHAMIGRDSTYEGFSYIAGAGFVRNQFHAEIQGSGGHCGLAGVHLLNGTQHSDTTITIEHQAPNGTSNQSFKSVLDGSAHGVFQGKVHVHKVAQKTDAYQLSNTLILSPTAEMDTKPELEIYADDVKCSHGATTGKMDEEPLFYMRSRGIPEAVARALLIEAFCAQALERVSSDSMKDIIAEKIGQWLQTHRT